MPFLSLEESQVGFKPLLLISDVQTVAEMDPLGLINVSCVV